MISNSSQALTLSQVSPLALSTAAISDLLLPPPPPSLTALCLASCFSEDGSSPDENNLTLE